MRNGSQTRGGRGINRNKWKGGKTWKYIMYIVLLVCFPWRHHARQERQLASWLAFKMSAQHANIAWKSGPCNKLTSSPIKHKLHLISYVTAPLHFIVTQCCALLLNVRKWKASKQQCWFYNCISLLNCEIWCGKDLECDYKETCFPAEVSRFKSTRHSNPQALCSRPLISNGMTGKAGGRAMMKSWTDLPVCSDRERNLMKAV